ncbi:hypothetical protein ABPG75_006685 [Micractinium tetrahymenae]
MPFSDEPTSSLWVAPLRPACRAQDVTDVFSSFGSIKAVRLGPAPAATFPGQQAAEVYFATVGQAAAALTALNAIVVPRLSGGHQLEIRCWLLSKPAAAAGAAAAHAHGGQAHAHAPAAAPAPAPAAHPSRPRGAPAQHGPPQGVLLADPSEPAGAVDLPGIDTLPDALGFCSSCCFKVVPEEERGSAAKWSVLQALLARGLRHVTGCTFRQLPVLLTHAGDELLKYRSSNPTVEAEYQSYPQAGRLSLLCQDIASPGLVSLSNDGNGTNSVHLHLGRLCSAGARQDGVAAGARGVGSDSGGSTARPASGAVEPRPGQAGMHYVRSGEPSRHLVLLGVSRDDAPTLAARARGLGTVQKHLFNGSGSGALTIHFEQQAPAEALAAEAAAGAVPGLAGAWAFEYKHAAPRPAQPTKAAWAPKQPAPASTAASAQLKAPPAPAVQKGQKAKPAVEYDYSDNMPSSVVRVKKLGPQASREALFAFARRHDPRLAVGNVNFYASNRNGYLFFSSEAAAEAAVQALRSGAPAELTGDEPLVVQYRVDRRQGTGAAGTAGTAAPAGTEPRCSGCSAGAGGSTVLRSCSACRACVYCSPACQLKDWNARHSAECGQLQQLAAVLQQAGIAGAAGTAGLDADTSHLLAAALRQPEGRQAAMLRALLGAEGSGGISGAGHGAGSAVASAAGSTTAAISAASSPGNPAGSIAGSIAGSEAAAAEAKAGSEAAAAEPAAGSEAAAAEPAAGSEAAAAEPAAGSETAAAEPAGPPAQVEAGKEESEAEAPGSASQVGAAPAAAVEAGNPAPGGGAEAERKAADAAPADAPASEAAAAAGAAEAEAAAREASSNPAGVEVAAPAAPSSEDGAAAVAVGAGLPAEGDAEPANGDSRLEAAAGQADQANPTGDEEPRAASAAAAGGDGGHAVLPASGGQPSGAGASDAPLPDQPVASG